MRLFLVVVLAVSGWGMAQSSEPSLVDLSKQARERKAKTAKPSRLITNADLKKFQNAPVSVSKTAVEGTVEPKPEPTPADQQTAESARDSDQWKKRLQDAVLNYKSAVNAGLVLQLRMNNLSNAFYTEQDDATRGMYEAQLEKASQDIEKNKQETAAARKAIDDLAAEARAAGVEEAEIKTMIGELPNPVTITDLEKAPAGETP